MLMEMRELEGTSRSGSESLLLATEPPGSSSNIRAFVTNSPFCRARHSENLFVGTGVHAQPEELRVMSMDKVPGFLKALLYA